MTILDTTIPDIMTAIRCHGIRDYRVETLPTLPPTGLQPGQLLIRVSRCGICAGDAKCYTGAPMFWGDDSGRKAFVQTPVIPGHEFCGVVVLGDRPGFEVGDSVTAEQVVACGQCLYCLKGMRWLCAPHDLFGFHTNVHGGLAEYMVIPAHAIVYKLPRSLQVSEQVYVEPLSCAVHGVERADVQLDDIVVVAGCGPIGLGMIAAAKRKAPARTVAVDRMESRLEIARECGADVLLRVGRDDVVSSVKEMTNGYGCDVYLEASGNPASVRQGLEVCRKAATFVEFSVFKHETTVDWTVIGDTKGKFDAAVSCFLTFLLLLRVRVGCWWMSSCVTAIAKQREAQEYLTSVGNKLMFSVAS